MSARHAFVIAGAHDDVANLVTAKLAENGVVAELIDGPVAARRFTLLTIGTEIRVTPSVLMFYRNSAWYSTREFRVANSDAAFSRDECYATIWAAAYASRLAVINRPTLFGFHGRLTSSSFSALDSPESAPQEQFASGPEELTDLAGLVWAETSDYDSTNLTSVSRTTPIRARRIEESCTYNYVTVVGERAFVNGGTELSREMQVISTRSVTLVRHFKLTFATVIWACTSGNCVPIRLNPDPAIEDILGSKNLVIDHLVQELLA
jgi:hypothetical protein